MSGWIKLHRKFLQWEWYDDVNVSRVFLHILLSANYKDKHWHGILIKRGQLVTSLPNLSKQVKLSVQSVRTALIKLKSTGELTDQSTSAFRLLTIVKYEEYQFSEDDVTDQATDQATGKQQASNRQATATKERKNINKGKEDKNLDIDHFENFWDVYGYKVGRDKSKIAYSRIIKQGVDHDEIIRGVIRYQQDCQARGVSGKYIKQPTTWLNGKHWQDEYPEYVETRKPTADDNCTAGILLALSDLAERQGH